MEPYPLHNPVELIMVDYHRIKPAKGFAFTGYELYYMNVMAGPKRTWKFCNDSTHDWLAWW